MHRLFVALVPPPPVIDPLIDTMDGIEGARWQSDEQLHLTLRFVGEVDAPVANDLADALRGVRAGGFDLRVAGVGHFERKGRATAVWAGIAPCEALLILQRRVERACRSAGLAPESRRFTPHITLARLGGRAGPIGGWLADHARLGSPPFAVSGFTLFESQLGRAGSRYDPVQHYPLSPLSTERAVK